jgi:RNA polymerase sigma-70 factor (ECF subfamily)
MDAMQFTGPAPHAYLCIRQIPMICTTFLKRILCSVFSTIRWKIVPFVLYSSSRSGVVQLASDVNSIGRMGLFGEIDILPAPRAEGVELPSAQRKCGAAVSEPVDPHALSDERLIDLLRSEDAEALDVLFSRHSRLVYGIALRILKDPGEAEEVVQECFLYLFRKAGTFQPSRGSAKVWIVQVAYSRARDRKEHLSRHGFYLRTDLDADELGGGPVGTSDPEREIGARLDFERLHQAFLDLSDFQRRTVQLFYFQGLDLREISECLHEPLGNVRHHFYRGLERLRKSAMAERLRNHRNENA